MSTHRVMFLCNDERGNFAERVESVEVADEIRLTCQKPRPPTLRFPFSTQVKVGRRSYKCRDHQTWVGNVFWDSVSMSRIEARILVRELLADGWSVEEHAEEGPFADLVEERRVAR